MKLVRWLGSLPVAIALIAALLVLLIVSTTFESLNGIPFAQRVFYRATWFDLFLSLLGVNIFCAALSRWPFEKRHTGFVITHIGIITLLVGSLFSRLFGVEGSITLFEGERWDRIQQEGYDIQVSLPNRPRYIFSVEPDRYPKEHRLQVPESDIQLVLHEIKENVAEKLHVQNENPEVNHALRFTLKSQLAGVEESLWLLEEDPLNPFSDQKKLGPATFRLKVEGGALEPDDQATGEPTLFLYQDSSEPLVTISLLEDPPKKIKIQKTDLKIVNLKYYSSAKVEEGEIVNAPEDIDFNPAVEFEIQDSEGQLEKHTKFFLFPDFESLHGRVSENLFNLQVELVVPFPEGEEKNEPALSFIASKDGNWRYQTAQRDGTTHEEELSVGQWYPTGWMDMEFRVEEVMKNAHVERVIETAPVGQTGPAAARLSLADAPEESAQWLLTHNPITFQTQDGNVIVEMGPRTHPLPFRLTLKDFRKVDYPGTQNASSFESDVVLVDLKENLKIETTISMNEPLDHAGFRIFQSSYIQDPQLGEASVFTVAKNPGIGLIYGGAIIILLGVVLLFYIKPFSNVEKVHNHE